MNKVVGYVVSIVGLVIMALGFNIINLDIELLKGVSSNVISGAGIAIIIVGVVLSMKGTGGRRRVEQAAEEVPIYRGVGKNRKIVGYRKG
jgi:uncharacterized membrane protein YidH (DUF202 family)